LLNVNKIINNTGARWRLWALHPAETSLLKSKNLLLPTL